MNPARTFPAAISLLAVVVADQNRVEGRAGGLVAADDQFLVRGEPHFHPRIAAPSGEYRLTFSAWRRSLRVRARAPRFRICAACQAAASDSSTPDPCTTARSAARRSSSGSRASRGHSVQQVEGVVDDRHTFEVDVVQRLKRRPAVCDRARRSRRRGQRLRRASRPRRGPRSGNCLVMFLRFREASATESPRFTACAR